VGPRITFDRSALLARVDGDVDLRNEVIALVLGDCPRIVGDIRRSVEHRRAGEIAAATDILKGELEAVAASPAAEAAGRLDRLARSGDLSDAGRAFVELEAEVAALLPELQAVVARVTA
jgi:hypothetical protein